MLVLSGWPLAVPAPAPPGPARAADGLGTPRAVLFIHVFKGMGTTVESALKRWSSAHGRSYLAYTRWMDGEYAAGRAPLASTANMSLQLSAAQRHHVNSHDVIAGHLLFGMHAVLSRPAVLITVMREPHELYASGILFRLRRVAARTALAGALPTAEDCEMLRLLLPAAEPCTPGRAVRPLWLGAAASAERPSASSPQAGRAVHDMMAALNVTVALAATAVAERIGREVQLALQDEAEAAAAAGTRARGASAATECAVRGPRLSSWLVPAPDLRGAGSRELLHPSLQALQRLSAIGLASRPVTTMRMVAYAVEAALGSAPSAEARARDGGRAAARWSWRRELRTRRNSNPGGFSMADVLRQLPAERRTALDALLRCESVLYRAARAQHVRQACAMIGLGCSPQPAPGARVGPGEAAEPDEDEAADAQAEDGGRKRVLFRGQTFTVPVARFASLNGTPATVLSVRNAPEGSDGAEGPAELVAVRWAGKRRAWEAVDEPDVPTVRRLLIRQALARLRMQQAHRGTSGRRR